MEINDLLKCRSCSELFPSDPAVAKQIYLTLMMKYHPDRCTDPRAAQASAVINDLYRRVSADPEISERVFSGSGGSGDLIVKYLMKIEHEYGDEYICGGRSVLELSRENARFLRSSPFADCELLRKSLPMKILDQAESFLPDVEGFLPLTDGGLAVAVRYGTEEIPLSSVISFCGGYMESAHAAWVISRLLGICCFGEMRGIVWNCLTEENLMISPENHTVRITGGWWYTVGIGKEMSAVQSSVYDNMPASCKTDGIARTITDLECVKAICRRIFPSDAPDAVQRFAENPCAESAVEEMEHWEDAIIKGFGGRKFTKMYISSRDIFAMR